RCGRPRRSVRRVLRVRRLAPTAAAAAAALLLGGGIAAPRAAAQRPAPARSFHERYAELVANPRRQSDSARLHELFRVNWEYLMTEFPEFATYVGYPGQNDRWTDNSLAAIERRKRELDEPLAVVKAIRRERLSVPDRLNYDLFRRRLEREIEGNGFQ